MWTTLVSSVMNYNNCQLNAIYTYTSILTTYNKLPKPIYYLSLEPFCAYASKNLGQNLGQKLGTDGQTDKTRYRVAPQLKIKLWDPDSCNSFMFTWELDNTYSTVCCYLSEGLLSMWILSNLKHTALQPIQPTLQEIPRNVSRLGGVTQIFQETKNYSTLHSFIHCVVYF